MAAFRREPARRPVKDGGGNSQHETGEEEMGEGVDQLQRGGAVLVARLVAVVNREIEVRVHHLLPVDGVGVREKRNTCVIAYEKYQ